MSCKVHTPADRLNELTLVYRTVLCYITSESFYKVIAFCWIF